jgi:predicted transcriptional regulator of viral defense system
MKKLISSVKKSLRNLFTEDDPTKIWVQIPRNFKTKKDQNYMIRRTKDFIVENTEVQLNKQK